MPMLVNRGSSCSISLVRDRGGLDPDGLTPRSVLPPWVQADLSVFPTDPSFLTAQEQIDLFRGWQRSGSSDAAFLAGDRPGTAASPRRKPEFLEEARQQLSQLTIDDLDPMPLLGCLDLLLGNVWTAPCISAAIRDRNSCAGWLKHPGAILPQCDYCRVWLKRDVLPGYRDVDATGGGS